MKVKFLRPEEIESEANTLLGRYEQQFGLVASPPVPLDEIAECCLELDLKIVNLAQKLQRGDALGAIWIADKRVMIDESLDPSTAPAKLGRYRFTLAHEIGHWVLHRLLFLALLQQSSLFGTETEPSVICRAGDPQPIEWQANAFAAYALMPTEMVYNAWEQARGSLKPYIAADEIADLSAKWSLAEDHTPSVSAAREMAKHFQVSAQAMQIRLTGLGLIKLHEDAPELFNKWGRHATTH